MPEISKARRTHELKCLPSMFQAVWDETMPFQVRNNDRDFMVGDRIVLIEWNPSTHVNNNDDLVYEGSTGRECRRIVTYVLRGGEFGIAPGHCVLGLALPDTIGRNTRARLADSIAAARAEAVAPVLDVLRQLVAACHKCANCESPAMRKAANEALYCDAHGYYLSGTQMDDHRIAAPLRAALALLAEHKEGT